MLVLERLKRYAKTDRVALISREQTLTYAELNSRAESFAAWLTVHFGNDRTPVVIFGEKEIDFLCCIFGALKSGHAYVPIDRTVPDERVANIVADVKPKVIVDLGGFSGDENATVLDADTLAGILHYGQYTDILHECCVGGDDPAYILFTSGSTGRPKGVTVTSANLESFCDGLLPWYPAEEGGVILHQISYSFDVSGCAVYAGLAHGMTLFSVDHEITADFGALFASLGRSQLKLWVSTPSFAELCVRSAAFDASLLPKLRSFLFCGEVLTHSLCDLLSERFPNADVLNTYGPTEATVLVTAVKITGEMRGDSRSIPIGEPIKGAALRLVDSENREVTEDGQQGELIILGASVGPGYFGRPDLTEKVFFTDAATGLRGYRTGDLCCRSNGLYYYCGRVDNQLKLNGFRVELEDIENNLDELPNVARAAVLPVWQEEKVQYLAAFVMLRQPDGLSGVKRTIALKRQLAEKLPAYMVPRKFFVVEAFPLNVNGKIDKKALLKRLEEST